jgi:hypothetical protein
MEFEKEIPPLAYLNKYKPKRELILTASIIPPKGYSNTSCRIKSDGIPGGEFRLEDSDGNLINLNLQV